jgi:hypothetical protein
MRSFAYWTIVSTMVFSLISNASEFKLKKFDVKLDKDVDVTVVELGKNRLSKSCLKSGNQCLAILALKKKVSEPSPPTELLGHPAARYCQSHDATNLIFIDQKKNEFDYCLFKDGSFINSWDLYNATH